MRGDLQDIFKMTPHEKQVMMFSATLSKDIRPICKKFMSNVSRPGTRPRNPSLRAGRPQWQRLQSQSERCFLQASHLQCVSLTQATASLQQRYAASGVLQECAAWGWLQLQGETAHQPVSSQDCGCTYT